MSDEKNLNQRGNIEGQFTQGVGGWAEYTVTMTEVADKVRHDVKVPPGKVIPVIFLPGVMGSNLRMTPKRQEELHREGADDNRAWRPDDITKGDVVKGSGFGGWYKNATPAERQLNFDPNQTEVDYYHYTENNARFDPTGAVTLASDARHQNVPDTQARIPPLLGAPSQFTGSAGSKQPASAAQVARWRGWSEVLFKGAYGTMLQAAERMLNNIVTEGKISPNWKIPPPDSPRQGFPSEDQIALTKLVDGKLQDFGASSGEPLTVADLMTIAPCWYPVHAMGYNFIKSNGESAVVIANRIRGLVSGYQKRGFKCDEVIIVTHSMGGLVARALIHPSYGNLLNDKNLKVLGIYHNAMPTIGAAGAYKRMRFGFQESIWPADKLQAKILGFDGPNTTAVLANAPAPLEMMPGAAYGPEWLKVVDASGKLLWSWPRGTGTALEDIYLKPATAWWRLINPDWVNPARVSENNGGGIDKVYRRLRSADKFSSSIANTFHPLTFASYCTSPKHATYGDVTFKIISIAGTDDMPAGHSILLPSPETWTLLKEDTKSEITVQANRHIITLKLQPGNSPGDATVPSARSARHIKGTLFEHGKTDGDGYEHQESYTDSRVLASMLYSIVKIAQTAKWN